MSILTYEEKTFLLNEIGNIEKKNIVRIRFINSYSSHKLLFIEWIDDKFGHTMSLEIPVYYDLLFKQLELDRDYTLYELGL